MVPLLPLCSFARYGWILGHLCDVASLFRYVRAQDGVFTKLTPTRQDSGASAEMPALNGSGKHLFGLRYGLVRSL